MKRLTVGNSVPEFVGTTAAGLSLSAQDLRGFSTLLQFNRFGVERSAKKFLNLKAWVVAGEGWRKGARFEPVANLTKEDTAGVPADFLIDPQGTIRHVSYGRHAADSMSVDDVLRAHRGD